MTGTTSIYGHWESCSAIATIRLTVCCFCSTQAMRAKNSMYPRRRRTRPGSADLIRRARMWTKKGGISQMDIRWLRTAPLYWSADIVDATLIDRMARLRGVGDSYHDYRGDLRYFSLK